MISHVCYRAARAGLITGVLLAVARVSGETAPLLFTALNNQFFSLDLNAPMASLPVVIFQFALSPYKEWQTLAWVGALLITARGARAEYFCAGARFEGKHHDNGRKHRSTFTTPVVTDRPTVLGCTTAGKGLRTRP